MTAISIDQIKGAAVGFLEEHAVDLGRYLVRAAVAWVRDRRKAEAAIERLHNDYVADFEAIEERMRDRGGEAT